MKTVKCVTLLVLVGILAGCAGAPTLPTNTTGQPDIDAIIRANMPRFGFDEIVGVLDIGAGGGAFRAEGGVIVGNELRIKTIVYHLKLPGFTGYGTLTDFIVPIE